MPLILKCRLSKMAVPREDILQISLCQERKLTYVDCSTYDGSFTIQGCHPLLLEWWALDKGPDFCIEGKEWFK